MSNTNPTRHRGGSDPAARGRQTARANGTIRREHRSPLPGNTARPHRVREALHDLYILELKRNLKRSRKLSARQLLLLAAAQLQVLQSRFAGFLSAYQALKPTSRTPVAWKVKRWVEVCAFLALPEVQWLRHYLLDTDIAKPNAARGRRPGRPSDIRYLWAMLWLLVCGRQTKDLFALHEELESPGAVKRWALGEYELPKVKAVYDAMLSLLGRKDPRAVWHVNIVLLRRLASLKDERGRLLHPKLMVYVYGDGKLIESDLAQRPYKGSHHRRAVNGKRRARATYITYVNQHGQVTTAVRGYKLILLVCQQSTLPVIGGLFPATYDERQAVLELIAELRAIWPEAPVTWFGGDALYDRSKRLHYELEFVHGIHPVAQPYNKFSRASPYHETKGVPKCQHGWMKRQKTRFVYDTPWRLRHGQPLSAPLNTGQVMDGRKRAMDKAYMVWTCRRGRCEPVTTRMKDDIRLYQFAARDGDSDVARFRQAYLLRRSAVETVFSVLGYFGVGDKAQRRMKWGGDIDMEWVVSLACLFMTGRRLVHEMGLYTKAYEEAIGKGLLRRPPWGTDTPWPVERSEGEDGSEPLPQAGAGGVGPSGHRARGQRHDGVEGTVRVRAARRGRPRSVRRARMLGSTPLDLQVAANRAAKRAEEEAAAATAEAGVGDVDDDADVAEGECGEKSGSAETQKAVDMPPTLVLRHWSVSLDDVVGQGGVAEPVTWRDHLRRRDAAAAAAAAQAQETAEPPVRRNGGQVPPPGTAFVDQTARKELLADVGAFEFDLLVDMQDILDVGGNEALTEPRVADRARRPSIGDDDLITVADRGVVELPEDAGPERDWVDEPLDPGDLDEKKYVKRFRDIDIEHLLDHYQLGITDPDAFGINNKGKAAALAEDLGIVEDLDDPQLDELRDADDPDAPADSTPDEDATDDTA